MQQVFSQLACLDKPLQHYWSIDMFKGMQRMVLASAVASVTLFGSVYAAETKELNFGIISTESSQNLKGMWDPFLAEMSKHTGMKINAFFAPDYAGIIQGMRFNKVDVAWYGNKSAMEAVDRAGGEVFAQTVAANGNPGYWSLLIAHKDSAVNSVDDMLKMPPILPSAMAIQIRPQAIWCLDIMSSPRIMWTPARYSSAH
jgi:hypothetical protein